MGDNSVAVGPESGRRPTSGLSGNVSNADDLDDDEKHYLSSWYKQTKDRMNYPKVKAVIAAQRFKGLLGKPKSEESEPEPEPEPSPEPEPTPSPEPDVVDRQQTPSPIREPTPPPVPVVVQQAPPPQPVIVRAPKRKPPKRRMPREVADPRENLRYIEPAAPRTRKRPNEISEASRMLHLEKWQIDFAMRFLDTSWGDPYFARSVMLDMNQKMRHRQHDIDRHKRQIMEMQKDHQVMREYVRELEQRNQTLKSNYMRQIPLEPEIRPPIPLESLSYDEKRSVQKRLGLVDDIRHLREKQFIDKEVLRDYSRRLGGHLSRPDMEAIRYFVPTHSAYENPQMDALYDDLKEKYYLLKGTVERQSKALQGLEDKLKSSDLIGKKQLDKIAQAHERDTVVFNERMRRYMDLRKHDPVLDYYQNYRSLLEDPRLEAMREAKYTERYRKSKLKDRIDQLDKEISDYRKSHVLNKI